jgi:hypothetical protein
MTQSDIITQDTMLIGCALPLCWAMQNDCVKLGVDEMACID